MEQLRDLSGIKSLICQVVGANMQQLEIGEEKTIAREEGSQVGGCQDDLEEMLIYLLATY